jgi:hypothetical protein
MPYTLYKRDGTILTTIADGNIDVTTTSLSLPGPNYVGYGDDLNENLIYLLESFASPTSPLVSQSLQGQLWFNKTTQALNVFTANGYQPVSGVTVSGTQPLTAKTGDSWYNTVTGQSYMFDGSTWNLIGPNYTKAQGISGAIPLTTGDTAIVGATHNVLKLQFGSSLMAMISADPTFNPDPPITGFPSINPGLTFNNTIANPTIAANIVGYVSGGVTGLVVGDVVGNVTGNVVAATLAGNLTGNVVAVTLSGALTGNTTSISSVATNFSSANAQITGGRITGLTQTSATTGQATNFSSSNVLITGGSATGLSALGATQATLTTGSATTLVATNFSSANAQITSGNVTGATRVRGTTGYFTNLSVANLVIEGGSTTNASGAFITLTSQNFSSANAVITGGSAINLVGFSSTVGSIDTLTVGTSLVTNGGNIRNTQIWNAQITNANLISPIATTPVTSDRSTKLATTAFVHNVVPTGAIIMWGGLVASIPAGWQLCDGSNGTPDLRDRFIVGAGSTYSPGATGGANSVTLATNQMPSHTHSVSVSGDTNSAGGHTHIATVSDAGHNHVMPGDDQLSFANGIGGWTAASVAGFTYDSVSTGGGGGRLWLTTRSSTGVGVTNASAPGHVHNVSLSGTSGSAGGTTAVDIRPRYYALCYIQKTY